MEPSDVGGRFKSDTSTQAGDDEKTAVAYSLDLFSTSPTSKEDLCFSECIYKAPYFALNDHDAVYKVIQGCCNHWDCPRCGRIRAKHEYGRIVEGARQLAEKHELYFITITCRGKEMSREESDKNYGLWCNKLMDAWRLQSKRTGQEWYYVAVTERQRRGHPHSHIITTFKPADLAVDWKRERVVVEGKAFMAYVSALRSDYIASSVVRSGLGQEYDITQVRTAEGASRYVAKYMFKDSVFNTVWPKGWRRVRYSQSFPKLTREKSTAYVLLRDEDWQRLAHDAIMIKPTTAQAMRECEVMLRGSDVILSSKLLTRSK